MLNKNKKNILWNDFLNLVSIKIDFDNGKSFQGENILIGHGFTSTRTKSFDYYKSS